MHRLLPALLVPALALAEPAPPWPTWGLGDTWTVATRYPPLVMGKKARQEAETRATGGTSPPAARLAAARARAGADAATRWTFKVTHAQTHPDGSRTWIVQAKDQAGAKDALGSLLFRRYMADDGRDSLALVQGKFLSLAAGEPVMVRGSFTVPPDPPRPVFPELSPIPYGFPPFPLPAAPSTTTTYEETRGEGELKFAFDTVLAVEHGVDAARIAGRPGLVEELAAAELPTTGLTLVVAHRAFDGLVSRQLWAPGYPWAIHAESGGIRSTLVYAGKGR